MSKKKITQKRLKEVLAYNPKTGIFLWKDRILCTGRNHGFAGRVAGGLLGGYIYIKIDGELTAAHCLAWLFVYGYLPENDIDHIDRIKTHNWIKNLREASRMCNLQNQSVSSNNSSGITGVRRKNETGKWKAYIKKNGKLIHLGYFISKLDAANARYEAEKKYFTCIMDSSAKKYIYSKCGRKENWPAIEGC